MLLSQDGKSLPTTPTDILGLAISPSVPLSIDMVVLMHGCVYKQFYFSLLE